MGDQPIFLVLCLDKLRALLQKVREEVLITGVLYFDEFKVT